MKKQSLPPLQEYLHVPIRVRALQLKKGMKLADVHWSAFFKGATVFLSQGVKKDQFKQLVALPGDYLIFRSDDLGWEQIVKKEDFESRYQLIKDLAVEDRTVADLVRDARPQNKEEAFTHLCLEKFGEIKTPEWIVEFYGGVP